MLYIAFMASSGGQLLPASRSISLCSSCSPPLSNGVLGSGQEASTSKSNITGQRSCLGRQLIHLQKQPIVKRLTRAPLVSQAQGPFDSACSSERSSSSGSSCTTMARPALSASTSQDSAVVRTSSSGLGGITQQRR